MNQSNSTRRSSWQPSPDIKCHNGSQPNADADFFIPPPPTIGEVLSVYTTLNTSSRPMSASVRWILVILIGGLLFAIVKPIANNGYAAVVFAVLGIKVALNSTDCIGMCSYVGTKGIVSYTSTWSRSAMNKEDLLLFDDAHSLDIISITVNPIPFFLPVGHKIYTWKKTSGNKYVIRSVYYRNKPVAGYPWDCTKMAESAWSNYLLSNINNELARNGYVEFSTVGTSQPKAIRIGSGFIELVSKKDGVHRFMVSDMQNISLGDSTFGFRHQDLEWWLGKGEYILHYPLVSNARVFLICLKELAGIS